MTLGNTGSGEVFIVDDDPLVRNALSVVLSRAGYQVTGVDTADHLAAKAHERSPSSTFVVGDVSKLPPGHDGPFQIVGFFDVLEHLDELINLLCYGGAVAGSVLAGYLLAQVP